jgi:phosphoenolpyruvate---glycerone phosphotransferase subunit DhaL
LSDPLAGIVRRWLLGAADDLIAAAVELTELDARIGDGDHGINLRRGMEAIVGWVRCSR